MEAEKLLEALRGDSAARLRHAVLKEAGVSPFSLRARFISNRQIIRCACFMALEREEEPQSGGFDMDRFRKMKGEAHGEI